jgi:Tol biopolymer transport system component
MLNRPVSTLTLFLLLLWAGWALTGCTSEQGEDARSDLSKFNRSVVAPHRILLHRLGPSGAEMFVAEADGAGEHPLLSSPGFDYNASFSPDGEWIVFTSERNGSADLYRVRPNGSGLERLTDEPAFDDQAAFSPEGRQLAFISTRASGIADLWTLNLETGEARRLTDGSGGDFRPSWSPDGRWIAFSSDRRTEIQRVEGRWEHLHAASIYVVSSDGSDLRRLTPKGRFTGSPTWSSDGERVVYYEMSTEDTWPARSSRHQSEATSQIVSVDVTSGDRTEHTEGPGLKVSPQHLEDGRIGYLLKAGKDSRLVFTTGGSGPNKMLRDPSWSPEGDEVVFHRPSFGDREQNDPLFSPDPKFELAWSEIFPAFSRDGQLVVSAGSAVIEREGVGDTRGLALVDAADEYEPLFYEEGSWAFGPSWSPDGERIAVGIGSFFAEREGAARIVSVRVDGSDVRELTESPPNAGFPSYSPDGRRIVYRVWSEGQRGLRILDLEDGSTAVLTTGYDNFPAWSPSEDRIAFTRLTGGNFDIYTVRPDGSKLKRLTDAPGNDAHPSWSPAGRHLLFSSSRLGFRDEAPLYDGVPQPYGKLFVMEADGSEPRPLTNGRWEEGTPAWDPRPSAENP